MVNTEMSDDVTTILRDRFDPTRPPECNFALIVATGPDAGQRFVIDGAQPTESLLGQSPICAVRLTDPEVSRRHLALEIVGARLRIRDLGSSNGTFVGGVQIVEALLSGEEQLRVGASTLQIERLVPSHAPALPIEMAFGRVMGVSREMRRLYRLLHKLAESDIPVLIEGETGTGKELLAESLHEEGARAQAPFIVLDCTAVPENLVESELFGHERGAFTGATSSRPGLFELAHGGTLFIDEIGELDRALQPKLLRALEKLEVRRVGGQKTIRVDVRVVAATNRNLDVEVQEGRFREDLFHRLAVGRVELPPLRRRRGDVPLLARHIWQNSGGAPDALDEATIRRWSRLAWPGNVRELRNVVLKRLALGDLADDPGRDSAQPSEDIIEDVLLLDLPLARARERVVADFERRYVTRLLAAHGGNVRKAAAAAGVARRYFQILKSRTSA
jgi:DNA-binding NtrC family response regulator